MDVLPEFFLGLQQRAAIPAIACRAGSRVLIGASRFDTATLGVRSGHFGAACSPNPGSTIERRPFKQPAPAPVESLAALCRSIAGMRVENSPNRKTPTQKRRSP